MWNPLALPDNPTVQRAADAPQRTQGTQRNDNSLPLRVRRVLRLRVELAVVGLVSAAGCAAPRVQGEAASVPVPATPAGQDAVVPFMQGMIGHHAQAVVMASLVPQRSSHPSVKLLAERIDISQQGEITLMRRWLQNRGHSLPDREAHVHAGAGHAELMPGMLTPQQLEQLGAARGTAFDRLFLQFMIRHHQGALQMVADLLARHRDLDAETFRFVSDIDADQRAEIQRMQTLLESLP